MPVDHLVDRLVEAAGIVGGADVDDPSAGGDGVRPLDVEGLLDVPTLREDGICYRLDSLDPIAAIARPAVSDELIENGPYRRLFFLSMMLMPLNSLFALAQPYVWKLTIDLFLTHNRTLPPRWLTPVLHAFGSHGLLAMGFVYLLLVAGEFAGAWFLGASAASLITFLELLLHSLHAIQPARGPAAESNRAG